MRAKNPEDLGLPFEVYEIAEIYGLIQIGLSWSEISGNKIIPYSVAKKLMMLHNSIKTNEKEEIEKSTKKMKKR